MIAYRTDPVCHSEVDPERAAGTSEYDGSTYYFDSSECKSDFDSAPARYAGRIERSQPR